VWRGGFPPSVCHEVWNSSSDVVRSQFQKIQLYPPKKEYPIWKVVYNFINAEAILLKNNSRYTQAAKVFFVWRWYMKIFHRPLHLPIPIHIFFAPPAPSLSRYPILQSSLYPHLRCYVAFRDWANIGHACSRRLAPLSQRDLSSVHTSPTLQHIVETRSSALQYQHLQQAGIAVGQFPHRYAKPPLNSAWS